MFFWAAVGSVDMCAYMVLDKWESLHFSPQKVGQLMRHENLIHSLTAHGFHFASFHHLAVEKCKKRTLTKCLPTEIPRFWRTSNKYERLATVMPALDIEMFLIVAGESNFLDKVCMFLDVFGVFPFERGQAYRGQTTTHEVLFRKTTANTELLWMPCLAGCITWKSLTVPRVQVQKG